MAEKRCYTVKEISDYKADLVFINKFDDEITIHDVCFLGLKRIKVDTYKSEQFPISLPNEFLICIKACQVVVKKHLLSTEKILKAGNSALNEPGSDTGKSVVDFYHAVDDCNTIDDILINVNDALGFFNNDVSAEFIADADKAIESESAKTYGAASVKRSVKQAYIKAFNASGGIDPVQLEDGRIQCPVCKKAQDSEREKCFNCSVKFI